MWPLSAKGKMTITRPGRPTQHSQRRHVACLAGSREHCFHMSTATACDRAPLVTMILPGRRPVLIYHALDLCLYIHCYAQEIFQPRESFSNRSVRVHWGVLATSTQLAAPRNHTLHIPGPIIEQRERCLSRSSRSCLGYACKFACLSEHTSGSQFVQTRCPRRHAMVRTAALVLPCAY